MSLLGRPMLRDRERNPKVMKYGEFAAPSVGPPSLVLAVLGRSRKYAYFRSGIDKEMKPSDLSIKKEKWRLDLRLWSHPATGKKPDDFPTKRTGSIPESPMVPADSVSGGYKLREKQPHDVRDLRHTKMLSSPGKPGN